MQDERLRAGQPTGVWRSGFASRGELTQRDVTQQPKTLKSDGVLNELFGIRDDVKKTEAESWIQCARRHQTRSVRATPPDQMGPRKYDYSIDD